MVQLGCRLRHVLQEGFLMSIIQQPTLFDIDFLEKLDVQEKYQEILSPLEWGKVLALFEKESRVGPPVK